MNAGMSFVAIVSLLLAMALAGGTAKKQASVNFNRFSSYAPGGRLPGGCTDPDFCGTNHNETMLGDTMSVQQADALSQWLTSVQVFIFNRFSSYAPGGRLPGGCDPEFCGTNHNETMLSDTMSVQQADTLSQWLTSVQVFIFNRFSSYAPGRGSPGGCEDPDFCGSNHNETMLSDTMSVQQADVLSQWLTSVEARRRRPASEQ